MTQLFPPVLESISRAMPYDSTGKSYYELSFEMPQVNTITSTTEWHAQVVIKNKSTNLSALNSYLTPDQQCLYILPDKTDALCSAANELLVYDQATNICTLKIPYKCFANNRPIGGQTYVIQVRFGYTFTWITNPAAADTPAIVRKEFSRFANWRRQCTTSVPSKFGEWSNTSKVFCYNPATIRTSHDYKDFCPTVHLFYESVDKDVIDYIKMSYNINTLNGTVPKTILINSIQSNMNYNDNTTSYSLEKTLPIAAIQSNGIKLIIEIRTANNAVYKDIVEYIYPVWSSYNQGALGYSIDYFIGGEIVDYDLQPGEEEDGLIAKQVNIFESTTLPVTNRWSVYRVNIYDFYTIKIASDIKIGNLTRDPISGLYEADSAIIRDFSVAMGDEYIYYVCGLDDSKAVKWILTKQAYNKQNTGYGRLFNMQNSFLTDKLHQLRLQGNVNISSFKINSQETFQTTLGSKYPYYQHPSKVKYRTLSVSALVSINFDPNSTFFKMDVENGLFWRDDSENEDLVVLDTDLFLDEVFSLGRRRVKEKHGNEYLAASGEENPDVTKGPYSRYSNSFYQDKSLYYDTLPSDRMVYLERKFREAVMNWLSNGKPKIFRSETEGNMIVMTTNFSFTPFGKSSRYVFTMSGTLTEIDEYNMENLLKYDLVPVDITPVYLKDRRLEFTTNDEDDRTEYTNLRASNCTVANICSLLYDAKPLASYVSYADMIANPPAQKGVYLEVLTDETYTNMTTYYFYGNAGFERCCTSETLPSRGFVKREADGRISEQVIKVDLKNYTSGGFGKKTFQLLNDNTGICTLQGSILTIMPKQGTTPAATDFITGQVWNKNQSFQFKVTDELGETAQAMVTLGNIYVGFMQYNEFNWPNAGKPYPMITKYVVGKEIAAIDVKDYFPTMGLVSALSQRSITDNGLGDFTYSLPNDAPNGLKIDSATGIITGHFDSAVEAGEFWVQVYDRTDAVGRILVKYDNQVEGVIFIKEAYNDYAYLERNCSSGVGCRWTSDHRDIFNTRWTEFSAIAPGGQGGTKFAELTDDEMTYLQNYRDAIDTANGLIPNIFYDANYQQISGGKPFTSAAYPTGYKLYLSGQPVGIKVSQQGFIYGTVRTDAEPALAETFDTYANLVAGAPHTAGVLYKVMTDETHDEEVGYYEWDNTAGDFVYQGRALVQAGDYGTFRVYAEDSDVDPVSGKGDTDFIEISYTSVVDEFLIRRPAAVQYEDFDLDGREIRDVASMTRYATLSDAIDDVNLEILDYVIAPDPDDGKSYIWMVTDKLEDTNKNHLARFCLESIATHLFIGDEYNRNLMKQPEVGQEAYYPMVIGGLRNKVEPYYNIVGSGFGSNLTLSQAGVVYGYINAGQAATTAQIIATDGRGVTIGPIDYYIEKAESSLGYGVNTAFKMFRMKAMQKTSDKWIVPSTYYEGTGLKDYYILYFDQRKVFRVDSNEVPDPNDFDVDITIIPQQEAKQQDLNRYIDKIDMTATTDFADLPAFFESTNTFTFGQVIRVLKDNTNDKQECWYVCEIPGTGCQQHYFKNTVAEMEADTQISIGSVIKVIADGGNNGFYYKESDTSFVNIGAAGTTTINNGTAYFKKLESNQITPFMVSTNRVHELLTTHYFQIFDKTTGQSYNMPIEIGQVVEKLSYTPKYKYQYHEANTADYTANLAAGAYEVGSIVSVANDGYYKVIQDKVGRKLEFMYVPEAKVKSHPERAEIYKISGGLHDYSLGAINPLSGIATFESMTAAEYDKVIPEKGVVSISDGTAYHFYLCTRSATSLFDGSLVTRNEYIPLADSNVYTEYATKEDMEAAKGGLSVGQCVRVLTDESKNDRDTVYYKSGTDMIYLKDFTQTEAYISKVYDTKADMDGAAGTIADGECVKVLTDETHENCGAIYYKLNGTLTFLDYWSDLGPYAVQPETSYDKDSFYIVAPNSTGYDTRKAWTTYIKCTDSLGQVVYIKVFFEGIVADLRMGFYTYCGGQVIKKIEGLFMKNNSNIAEPYQIATARYGYGDLEFYFDTSTGIPKDEFTWQNGMTISTRNNGDGTYDCFIQGAATDVSISVDFKNYLRVRDSRGDVGYAYNSWQMIATIDQPRSLGTLALGTLTAGQTIVSSGPLFESDTDLLGLTSYFEDQDAYNKTWNYKHNLRWNQSWPKQIPDPDHPGYTYDSNTEIDIGVITSLMVFDEEGPLSATVILAFYSQNEYTTDYIITGEVTIDEIYKESFDTATTPTPAPGRTPIPTTYERVSFNAPDDIFYSEHREIEIVIPKSGVSGGTGDYYLNISNTLNSAFENYHIEDNKVEWRIKGTLSETLPIQTEYLIEVGDRVSGGIATDTITLASR